MRRISASGSVARAHPVRKVDGLTVTLQNIKTERRLDTSLVDDPKVKNDLNILLADPPPLHVSQRAKVRSGAKSLLRKEETRD